MGSLAAAFSSTAGNEKDLEDKPLPRGRGLESIIADRDAELAHPNADLEISVAERTARLNAVNDGLRSQVAELSARNREITLLGKMRDFLQTSVTEAEAYSVIAETSTQLLPGDSGAVFVLSASRDVLEAAAVWGPTPVAGVIFSPSECWAHRRGQTHVALGHELRCAHVTDNSRLSMCVPLLALGETLGILHIMDGPAGNSNADERRMAEKCRLAESLADNIGLGIGNLKLRESLRRMAIRDPLTGLYNRRYMEEALAQEVCRTQRNATQLAIIMLDIDHLKQFNDTFGHDAGDAVLRELGEFLRKHVRGSDIACRYGGDEFILILSPSAGAEGAQRAEKIREDIRHLRVDHANRDLGRVTLSMGVAVFPDHGAEVEAVVKAADVALYQAKRSGRDQVVVFAEKAHQMASRRPQNKQPEGGCVESIWERVGGDRCPRPG